MGDALRCSPDEDPELRSPPPPPPLLKPRPPPGGDRAPVGMPPSPTPECDERSVRLFQRGLAPEDVPLSPPPPLGSSRPERLSDRLEREAAQERAGMMRSESPTPRSIWRRLSPSPPRSPLPAPAPPKRPRLDDGRVGRRSPPRSVRIGLEHGRGSRRGMDPSHRASDCTEVGCDLSNDEDCHSKKKRRLSMLLIFALIISEAVVTTPADSRSAHATSRIISGLKCHSTLLASELSARCILNDNVHVISECCVTDLMTIVDNDKECFCDVVDEFASEVSSLGARTLWTIYETC